MARSRRPRPAPRPPVTPAPSAWRRRAPALAIAAIVALAAVLRLAWPGAAPPGINQDEALSGWIAWCLLKTGHAMTGEAWPVFYTHGIGDNPTMLYFYTLLPFQALFGLDVWTTRLPAALAGIAAVWLAWDVGRRLFDTRTGLLAALFLALAPWSVLLGRLGFGASQCPFFALLPVALMLRANLPLGPRVEGPPRAWPAALAGLTAGLSCYGFHAMRLYFPVFFAALAALNARAWWETARLPAGRKALLALAAGLAVTAGPLAWKQVTDPQMLERWQMTRLWQPGTPLPRILELVGGRYAAHFGPDFLFERGDTFRPFRPVGQGEFGWHLLPGMLAGIGLLAARVRARRPARVLLAMLLAYPAGDVISAYDSVHCLRSAPGLGALALLAAWGWSEGLRLLAGRGRVLAGAAAAALALGVVALDVGYLPRFLAHDRDPGIRLDYQTDLLDVARWLRPNLDQADAVFCTTTGFNEPFSILMVGLRYDPRRWFREVRDRRRGEYDYYVRVGKLHFLYGDLANADLDSLRANGRVDHVLFVVRPGELGLGHPVYEVRDPQGRPTLWVCARSL